jgi:hypothetical protein
MPHNFSTPFFQAVGGPKPIFDGKSCKEHQFGRHLNLANLGSSGRRGFPMELGFVRGFGGVLTVIGEFPRYITRNSLKQVDGSKLHSKGGVLANVLERYIRYGVNLSDPFVIAKGLLYVPFLPHRNFVDKRENIFRLRTVFLIEIL